MLGLDRIAGPQFDQRTSARQLMDLVRVLGEDGRLGAGGIVLGLPSDLLEQAAALGVVQEAAVQPLGLVAQARSHRACKG